MIRLWTVLFCCCLVGASELVGQTNRQFVFTHYDSENGLPINVINDIEQDTQGFYWLATLEGLVRFDGIRSKVFKRRKSDPNSVPFSNVSELRTDRKNRLWLLHSDYQVGYFNPNTWQFTPVPIRPQIPANGEGGKHFINDHSESIFLSVHQEILVFDEQQSAFVPATKHFPHKPGQKLYGFWEHPDGKFGLMTENKAELYDPVTGNMLTSGTPQSAQVTWLNELAKTDDLVYFCLDSKQRIWILRRTAAGFVFDCYDLNTQEHVYNQILFQMPGGLSNNWFQMRELSGMIWIYGENMLAWFNETTRQFVPIPSGHPSHKNLEYSGIHNLFEDHEHNIWICSNKNGLYRFNPSRTWFNHLLFPKKNGQGISEGSPMAVLPEPDGSLLVNLWGEGFYRLDSNWQTTELGIPNLHNNGVISMWDVCLDQDKVHAWFVGQPGIIRYNRYNRHSTYINPAILEDRTIRDVEQDPQGNLWLGTQSVGVFKWDRQRGQTDFEKGLYQIPGLPINRPINQMFIDSRGWVWVATGLFGLYVIDSQTDQVLFHFSDNVEDTRFKLPEKGISQVLEYSDSLMMFATSSELFAFNVPERQLRVLRNDEEINSLIADMRCDRYGNIWLGTLGNLYRFHPYKSTMLTLNREDGILDDVFSLNSHHELPDGRLAFGADHSLMIFDPAQFRPSANNLKVHITDVSIGNKPQSVDSLLRKAVIELGPHNNAIVIEFATMSFNDWHNVQYKMEGLDADWVLADKDFRAIYNYLPPGTYRFLLRTINADQETSPVQHPFTIKVYPPFYQSWWFFGVLLLLAMALLYWYDQERLKRRAAVDSVRNNIAEDLHTEVNTALQNINILSEMANIKVDNDPQKTKEYIHQIHAKSNDVIDAMDDMLWGISPEHDNMQSTVHRIEEWVAILNRRYDTKIGLLIDPAVASLQVDMQLRYGAFLLFKEAIKGLVTVCPQGYRLHVGVNKRQWQLLAEYAHEDFTTIALNNLLYRPDLSQRLESLQGSWQLQERTKGFAVLISIPISPSNA
ncbi:MAG: hypothetical protein J0M29_05370 [Chitinophagales bacterium]|nr:hypothetical protein [Chitinophagales bacterium]